MLTVSVTQSVQPSLPEETTVEINSPSGQAQRDVEQVDPITRNRALKPMSELNEGEFLGLRYIIHTASSTAIATDESIEQATHDTSIARATPLPRLRWQDYYSNMMLAKVAAKSMQDDCSVKSLNNRTTEESKTIPSIHQSVTDNASMSCLIADHGGRVCVLGRMPMSQLEALSAQAIQARAPDDLIRRLARDVQRARAWIQQVDAMLTSTTEPSRTGDDVVADDSENSPFADQLLRLCTSTALRPQDSNSKEGPPPLQRIDNAETSKQEQTIANKPPWVEFHPA